MTDEELDVSRNEFRRTIKKARAAILTVDDTDSARTVAALPLASALSFTPLSELLKEPDEQTVWLVANRLPVGGLSLLCGKPKTGKSTLTRNLAFAVSRGQAWLGMPTTQGMVFYLALGEEKRSQVRKHFQKKGVRSCNHTFARLSAQRTGHEVSV